MNVEMHFNVGEYDYKTDYRIILRWPHVRGVKPWPEFKETPIYWGLRREPVRLEKVRLPKRGKVVKVGCVYLWRPYVDELRTLPDLMIDMGRIEEKCPVYFTFNGGRGAVMPYLV